jgi:hypothetical protein
MTGVLRPVDPPRPRWWTQVVLVVGFAWAYDEVRALHGNVVAIGVRHGGQVLHADRTWHLDWAFALNRWLSHHDAVADVLAGYYVVMHLGATSLVLLLLYVQGEHYRQQRNVLLFASVVGLVVYWCYPAAPPRLLGQGFHDTVAHALPFAYSVETSSANLYAAIPSLHLAWAVWVSVAVWSMTTRWWWRALALAHPALTTVTVLATGNHYTLDLLAGIALTLLSYPAYAGLRSLSVLVRREAVRQPRDRRRAHVGGLVSRRPADHGGHVVRRADNCLADRRGRV